MSVGNVDEVVCRIMSTGGRLHEFRNIETWVNWERWHCCWTWVCVNCLGLWCKLLGVVVAKKEGKLLYGGWILVPSLPSLNIWNGIT